MNVGKAKEFMFS